MPAVRTLISKHAAVTYVALTFAISWGLVAVFVGPGGFPGTAEQTQALLPYAVLGMVAGPSVAGIALTIALGGRPAWREFRRRLLNWNVPGRWYAAALLIAPAAMAAVLLTLSIFSDRFVPAVSMSANRAVLVLPGLAIALVAGLFEEVGWTGFAVPTLRRRHGVFATGILVGVPWAMWHWLVAICSVGPSPDAIALASYLLDPLFFLVGFRVLMVWVYDRTESILIGMIMHASLTGSALILGAAPLRGAPLLVFDVAWFVVIWVVVAASVRSGLTERRERADFVRRQSPASAIYISELHWRVLASGIWVLAGALALWFARVPLTNMFAAGILYVAPAGWQSVASYAVDATAGTVGVAGLLMLASAAGAIASTQAQVTSETVIVTTGVLRQHTFEMPLEQVEAVSVNQSFIGRWLNYGTVVIAGTGGTREAIDCLAAPHDFRRRIVERGHAPDAAATIHKSA